MAGVGVSRNALMLLARAVTAVVVIPAIIVASQGFSVLYVFLVADLLGAAIAVPMLTGLYSTRMPGWAVLLSSAAGIIIGALFYPRSDLVSPMLLTAPPAAGKCSGLSARRWLFRPPSLSASYCCAGLQTRAMSTISPDSGLKCG